MGLNYTRYFFPSDPSLTPTGSSIARFFVELIDRGFVAIAQQVDLGDIVRQNTLQLVDLDRKQASSSLGAAAVRHRGFLDEHGGLDIAKLESSLRTPTNFDMSLRSDDETIPTACIFPFVEPKPDSDEDSHRSFSIACCVRERPALLEFGSFVLRDSPARTAAASFWIELRLDKYVYPKRESRPYPEFLEMLQRRFGTTFLNDWSES